MAVPTDKANPQTITAAHINAIASLANANETLLATKASLASPAFTGTPTGITKTHVGLANVDNTSDANKPISTAVTTAFGNVDNTSDANKPISTAVTTALAMTPWFVYHDGVTDPPRPATTRPVEWFTPDANRPATNGTTAGGTYAAVNNLDIIRTF